MRFLRYNPGVKTESKEDWNCVRRGHRKFLGNLTFIPFLSSEFFIIRNPQIIKENTGLRYDKLIRDVSCEQRKERENREKRLNSCDSCIRLLNSFGYSSIINPLFIVGFKLPLHSERNYDRYSSYNLIQ